MPPLKEVPLLLDLSVDCLHHVVREEALRVSKVIETKYVYEELYGTDEFDEEAKENLAIDREIYLSEQVGAFKDFVFSHVPMNMLEDVMVPIVVGISQAISCKKRMWSPTTNMSKFTKAMYAITKFANLIVSPLRQVLDLNQVPKMIRTKLYNSLPIFKNLRTLILGSGSGGWISDVYSEKFAVGLPHMRQLVHLSLKYDCNSYFLHTLAQTCSKTLRVLDIEHSKQVNDDCVAFIKALANLVKINVFRTYLTVQGQADLLVGLPQLSHLERGDFLADVIEHLHEKYINENEMPGKKIVVKMPSLKVQEFWASEEYFFHTEEQMALVSKYCPEIKQMLFMFQKPYCQLSVLASFTKLEDLDLWGGAFYTDGLCDLLEQIGTRLKKLSLVHVEEMDARAIAIITVTCPNLVKLGLHNCDFEEEAVLDHDDPFRDAERILRMEKWREVQKFAAPMLDLEIIRIVSQISERHLILILSMCINVKEIFMGMLSEISDRVWSEVLAKNSLSRLEKINIQKCSKMTMHGIELLLANCDRLTTLQELTYFEGISEADLEKFRSRIKQNNLNIKLDDKVDSVISLDLQDANFMNFKLKDKYPPFDNSAEWETGWAPSNEVTVPN